MREKTQGRGALTGRQKQIREWGMGMIRVRYLPVWDWQELVYSKVFKLSVLFIDPVSTKYRD